MPEVLILLVFCVKFDLIRKVMLDRNKTLFRIR